ncbi:hypothetical protein GPECTOR_322g31 [Gonium pectorale]|uniref:Uncharacterized protein n=1 Tax=Gonium pectorale TaxID=33097 RepID=A0A150FVN9_GONPE|nr:hypothetical protein GPECTOR_322g31 [Gonium pectorale]|eukprot:KXZ41682.1 hypothetical protein GPECTOR_322g31 [Gonium pectorale]
MAKDKEPNGDAENGHHDAAEGASNASQTVLQYFWDLASYDEQVRVAAARGLVTDLLADQAKHAAGLGKDTASAPEDGSPKIQQLEYHLRRCSPTMVYTLRRLARGLGSSRAAARQGFATALTGLLAAGLAAPVAAGGFLAPAGVLVLLDVCLEGPSRGGVGPWVT